MIKLLVDDEEARLLRRDDSAGGITATLVPHVTARGDSAAEAFPTTSKFLVGERNHRLYPLDSARIDYIESDANYVTIHSGQFEYISRNSVKHLETALADLGFVRIERSLLINIRAVAYVEVAGRGTYAFTLASGACLHSSATYRDAILRVLPLSRRGTPDRSRRPGP